MSLEQALVKARTLKNLNKKLVFTNGCFDLFHLGHLRYLAEARALGDFLIVGLNSDLSVSRLKGPLRPIRNETERAEMLAGLIMVDAVIIFEADTPLELIKSLKPQYLVKGGDWAEKDIVGAAQTRSWGGETKSLNLLPGYSTSNLIEKIFRLSRLDQEK
jgi:D-beta-D-heptose 7-phosphate kinase/D-beta-D-heptose 1-phosphate adenosyltransferase